MQRTTNPRTRAGGAGALGQIIITYDVATKLVITSAPASATAGTDFSITVQVQDGGGSPVNVSADTTVSLTSSGLGTLSGETAIIPAGQNSVTLNTVQDIKAETITLTATRIDGDLIADSDPSSPITINAGAASQLSVETAPDGTGVPVGNNTLYPTNALTVYAISRDDFDNFVANETATWSLAKVTGNIVSGSSTVIDSCM